MCSECYQVPCHPRCPNGSVPLSNIICDGCGEPVELFAKYAEGLDGDVLCEICIEDMTKEQLLGHCLYSFHEADERR